MASNIDLNPGTGGQTVRTTEVGGAQIEHVILAKSDGTLLDPTLLATAAKQDTGNVSIASIDGKITACNTGAVVISSSALPSGAATAARQDTGNTSLASIDGKITACNTGAVTISAALPAGNNNIGDVDVTDSATRDNGKIDIAAFDVALPAGTNAIGKLTANSGVDIGDVDVTSCALPTGASTLAEQQTQTTSLSVLDDWDESDRAKVNIIVGQAGITAGAGAVAANSPRVTLASDDPAVAVLGATGDAAVSTDTTGSISAKTRGIIKILTTLSQSQNVLPGTAITFKNTAGDITMTMKNIASGAGRVSNQQDRGAGALPGWYEWKAVMEAASAITIGLPFRVYCFQSNTTTADITTDTALTVETQLSNFQLLGSVYASSNAVGPFYARGYVFLPGRYVNLGWWNASGQTSANTDGTCAITLTPMPPNWRPWS